jgi:hypothetical protein
MLHPEILETARAEIERARIYLDSAEGRLDKEDLDGAYQELVLVDQHVDRAQRLTDDLG